jgi:hypothetical protein
MSSPASKPVGTPLAQLLRACNDEQREYLARNAGTTVNYLYLLGGCHREKVSVQLAFGIETASGELHKLTNGATPIVTAKQISVMCQVADFTSLAE